LEAVVVLRHLWAKFEHETTTVIGGEFNDSIDDLSSSVCSGDDAFVVSAALLGVGVSWSITASSASGVLLVLLNVSAPYTGIVPPEGLLSSGEFVRSTENRRSGKWGVHETVRLNKSEPSSEDE
jgi:hypothetical protein